MNTFLSLLLFVHFSWVSFLTASNSPSTGFSYSSLTLFSSLVFIFGCNSSCNAASTNSAIVWPCSSKYFFTFACKEVDTFTVILFPFFFLLFIFSPAIKYLFICSSFLPLFFLRNLTFYLLARFPNLLVYFSLSLCLLLSFF